MDGYLSAPNTFALSLMILACVLALVGIVQIIALLEKPAGWYCHARGACLITLFVYYAVMLCLTLASGKSPGMFVAVATLASGTLYVLFARQLRIASHRRAQRRAEARDARSMP
jgi:hypothetical protein